MEELKEDKKPMTKEEAQNKLVELSFVKDALKKQYEDLDKQLEEVCTTLGVGYMFEDKDGTVYKVDVPKGHFVSFKHIGFARTRRGDEKAGTLTLKEAKEWKEGITKQGDK
jgi:hypothetical protein